MTRVSAFQATSAFERWGAYRLAPLTLVILGLLQAQTALAQDVLPQDGSVAQGSVTISTNQPGHMVLNQSSDRAVVNWGSFSIGSGNSVNIVQPDTSSAILNRVTGDTTSQIHGRLTATGQVFVVNPNGLFIGKGGEVTAGGGFVGSTLDTTDDDFMAGRLRFEGNGSSAEVSNAGRVTIGRGGFAALLGGRVSNSGLVMVPMGKIGLGAGEKATLDVSGDGFLQVEVPSDIEDEMRALINNSGTVSAEGGLIEMKAATARHAARHAINLSGVAEARSVSVSNGTITLGGGAGGRVTVSGRVSTRAKKPQRPAIIVENSSRPKSRRGGGDITILGRSIELNNAVVDASGAGMGGTIHIGGAYQGGDTLPSALYLDVDSNSAIRADAIREGDGGRIVLWSDINTDFAGNISATGGAVSGDGGFVEVSGKQKLGFNGIVDTSALFGTTGTLLLDPYNVFIEDVTGDSGGAYDGNVFMPAADDSILDVNQLSTNLATNNITVTTGGAANGGQNGDITVNAQIDWVEDTTLTLNADGDVRLNAGIISTPALPFPFDKRGDLVIQAGGTITTGPGGAVDVDVFILSSGDWTQVDATLPLFSATDFRVPLSIDTRFLRATSGDGSVAAPYELVDIYGVQGIRSQSLLGDNFALAQDVNAFGTADWNAGDGFASIRGLGAADFTGSLDGRGYEISGLRSIGPEGGFFNSTNGATILDLSLDEFTIIGNGDVGGLVNTATDTTIDNISINATLVGETETGTNLGGVVGRLIGTGSTLSNSNVVAGVSVSNFGGGDANLGGLVGTNLLGTIFNTDFVGMIDVGGFDGTRIVGGAVGVNSGTIDTVTANVLAASEFVIDASGGVLVAGGLVGSNESLEGITNSTSGGLIEVVGTSRLETYVGGLVGINIGAVTESTSLADISVESGGEALNVGGLIGLNENTVTRPVNNVDATGAITVMIESPFEATDLAIVGGLVGTNLGFINDATSAGDIDVTSSLQNSFVGGLVGLNAVLGEGTGGLITAALSTSSVSYETDLEGAIGGFAGVNEGDITDAVATGEVEMSMSGFAGDTIDDSYLSGIGGFAATNRGMLARVAAHGNVTGQIMQVQSAVGGLLGGNENGEVRDAYATGAVTGASDALQAVGGLVGATTNGEITNTYSNGAVSFSGTGTGVPGGLIGYNDTLETTLVSASYWDMTTSGQLATDMIGFGEGLTTAEFENTESFFALAASEGWDFDAVWAPGSTGQYPAIYTIDQVVFAQPDALDLTYGETIDAVGTGTVAGGPGVYVFALAGETLDTAAAFNDLNFAGNSIGTQGFTVGTTALTSSEGETYRVVSLVADAEISPALLELTLNDQTKTYGSLLTFDGTEFTLTGGELFFADAVDSLDISSTGAAAATPVAGSPYAITSATDAPVLGTGMDNYAISIVDGALTVDAAPLELTVNDQSKTYGGALAFDGTEFSITGGELFFADTVETITIASLGGAADAQVADGPYAITGSGPASGTRSDNYAISIVDGALTVGTATLEVTANDQSKTYGEALVFDGTEFTITGGQLFFADAIDSINLSSAGAAEDAQVAGNPYAITLAAPVTGTGLANYSINRVNGALTVDPADLTITPDNQSKDEGDVFAFAGTEFTTRGLLFGDTVSDVQLDSLGAIADAADGDYAIEASNASGDGLANYNVAFETGTLVVTPEDIPDGGVIIDIPAEGDAEILPVPTPAFTLPNPRDTVDLTIAVIGGDDGSIGRGSGGIVNNAAVSQAWTTLGVVQEISTTLETSASNCSNSSGNVDRYLACMSDALDDFAGELDAISTELPPGMENVARIVRDARQKVTNARTRARSRLAGATTEAQRQQIRRDAIGEARVALNDAAAEIRNSISFVRADDPELASVQRATITTVASAMDNVSIELSRATGL